MSTLIISCFSAFLITEYVSSLSTSCHVFRDLLLTVVMIRISFYAYVVLSSCYCFCDAYFVPGFLTPMALPKKSNTSGGFFKRM